MVDHPIERAVMGNKNGFEALLEETIMSSIRDLLGESSMRAILYHLNLERVGSDPQAFDAKLRELLSAPASIIEEIIIKDLFKRLDLFYSPKGAFDFQRYVSAAREFYGSREKKAA
jgi:hypothetical protein